MLKDNDLKFTYDPNIQSEALAWVIDQEVVYDLPLVYEIAKIFLYHDSVEDISSQFPDHDGITVRFIKDGQTLEELQTTELFGSVLLSNPIVVNLDNHKYGAQVVAGHAKFINYEFVLSPFSNPRGYDAWRHVGPPEDGQIAKCYRDCNCGWKPA